MTELSLLIQKTLLDKHELLAVLVLLFFISVLLLRFFKKKQLNENEVADQLLKAYLSESLSNEDIGLEYERYIGYIHEIKNQKVKYNGALNGVSDMGRDLIVSDGNKVAIIQTKCWASYKTITENHIFQLYGSAIHFSKTSGNQYGQVVPIFYTSATYSNRAQSVAKNLGVILRTEKLNRSYPMIKCVTNQKGQKVFYLPFDEYYDSVKVDFTNGGMFLSTVRDAVKNEYIWSRSKQLLSS